MVVASLLKDIENAVLDFIKVAKLAGGDIEYEDICIEYLSSPHVPPKRIPKGKVAVYIFFYCQKCLKVGQVGKKSNARYISQHYNPNSSISNLAKSILKHQDVLSLSGLTTDNISEWIKTNTDRINILIDASLEKSMVSLLEVFMHCRLKPEFEGQG